MAWSHSHLASLHGALATRTPQITSLPDIPHYAESDDEKLALARAWLRCWMRIRSLVEPDA